MEKDHYTDEEQDWDESIMNAVKYARDHITALPAKFRPRALAMLNVSFQDEIQPPYNDAWQRRRYPRAARRFQTKS